MNLQTHLKRLIVLFYILLTGGILLLLLPALAPFLVGLALACLLEKPVAFLSDKAGLKRPWSSALVLLTFTLLLLAACFFLVRRAWYELGLLSNFLPDVLDLLNNLNSKADKLLYRLSVALPTSFREELDGIWNAMLEQLTDFVSRFGSRLLSGVGRTISILPRAALFFVTALLAAFFIAAGRSVLFPFFKRQIPEKWLPRLELAAQRCKEALGGWLRAQGILLCLTFLLLGGGFLLMGLDLALLLAAGVALLDALPVLGTGTILLPWAVFCLLSGRFRRAAALLLLYAVIWLTRSLVEPRLIARQAGLHPLAALLSMYLGFTLFGVPGMLLAPLAAVALYQLHTSRVIRLWK